MPCQHPIKLNKLCALCGQEVQDTENTKFYNALHSNSRLRVDKSTIDGMYVRYRDELIQKKKMILVVDLDQTILHSIEVKGGRVGDNGSRNRNGECGGRGITNKQLLQARPRQPLPSSFTYTLASTTMKTTLRPHLHTFLTELNEMFHMHIYTMGTSEYVHQITNVIDRDRSLFGDRIVTRDDEVLVKRLERLFGDREDMVVVIDDRGDVWEYCGNLVMIRPFFGVDCGGEE
ncbi:FCP1-like phosphatase, phosphatase domain-containing protein, partial [Vavraia culicis subsp. floridensis]